MFADENVQRNVQVMLFLSLLNSNLLQSKQTEKKKRIVVLTQFTNFKEQGQWAHAPLSNHFSLTMDVLNVNQGLDIISTSTTA